MLVAVGDLVEDRVSARAPKPPRADKPPSPPKEPKEPKRPTEAQDEKERKQRRKRISARAEKRRSASDAEKKGGRLDRLARLKKARQADEPLSIKKVPSQIAHCMMALHVKRGKSKEAAWNICRWAMTQHGYLQGPYRKNAKLPKATKPTQKGSRRNMQHSMEKRPLNGGVKGDGQRKFRRFVNMFSDFEKNMLPKKKK